MVFLLSSFTAPASPRSADCAKVDETKNSPASRSRAPGQRHKEAKFLAYRTSYHATPAVSIKVTSHVWEHSDQRGTALLLLLAIADHAHDDGGGAYPSIPKLARKARTTERNVKLLLPKLEAAGELRVQRGKGFHGTNLYTVLGVKDIHPISNGSNDGSNDGLGESLYTPSVHQISPPPTREFTVPPERDIRAYLKERGI